MKLEIEIPDKYARKLETIEEFDPTVRDQIEVEVLPEVLRLINEIHRQLQNQQGVASDVNDPSGGDGS